MPEDPNPMSTAPALLLFDGRCGLCNRLVQFVLRRDARGAFVFAPLQSELGRQALTRHGRSPTALDTFVVIDGHGTATERAHVKGRAALLVLRRLGFPWSATIVLGVLPTAMLDLLYDFVARRRIAWFGAADVCGVATPAQRARFLATDLGEGRHDD
jgi:predicted DCC family thiol-disulfide oxidoreductase YuxK